MYQWVLLILCDFLCFVFLNLDIHLI